MVCPFTYQYMQIQGGTGQNWIFLFSTRDLHDPVLCVATLLPMFPIRYTILHNQSLQVSHGQSRPNLKFRIPSNFLSEEGKGIMRDPLQGWVPFAPLCLENIHPPLHNV